MNRVELKKLFNQYLKRDFTEIEWIQHGRKNYSPFENELLNCNEYLDLIKPDKTSNKKIALLLSGHIRNNTITNNLFKFLPLHNVDIFIHTWDNKGIKGKETNLNDSVNEEEIIKIISQINNVKNFKIENNKTYIESILSETNENIYFNHSSPEIFIKSQLYSIYQSYELMNSYSNENNVNYDVVIRLRFDCEIVSFNLTDDVISDINNNKIIFVPNKDCGHHHPDSDSTSCIACDVMYHKYKLKSVHISEHTNIICDIFAYGSQESMKDYCYTYLVYDEINKSFIDGNLKSLNERKINFTKINNVYKIKMDYKGHLESVFYLNCSYPEKILQKKLKDYMLVESKDIKIKFKR
jgi:hypothetical protein